MIRLDEGERVQERAVTRDSKYITTTCLQHRPRHERRPVVGVVSVCANPWCRSILSQPEARNASEGVRQLLGSVEESARWLVQRQAQARRLVLDARQGRVLTAERLRSVMGHGVVQPDAVDVLASYDAGPATSPMLLRGAMTLLMPWKGVRSHHYNHELGRLVVDCGVNRIPVSGRLIAGRRGWNIATVPAAIGPMGIDNNTANPGNNTRQLDTTAANRSIKAADATFPSITPADGSVNAAVVVLTQSTWTQADNPGPKTFLLRRIGQLNATDNSLDSLYSLLGGTSPTSILNLDYTGLTTFTLKPQIETTLSNQSAQ